MPGRITVELCIPFEDKYMTDNRVSLFSIQLNLTAKLNTIFNEDINILSSQTSHAMFYPANIFFTFYYTWLSNSFTCPGLLE